MSPMDLLPQINVFFPSDPNILKVSTVRSQDALYTLHVWFLDVSITIPAHWALTKEQCELATAHGYSS